MIRILNFLNKPTEKIKIVALQGQFSNGLKICLHHNYSGVWQDMIAGGYDTDFFKEIAKPDQNIKVVWDIGAHVGYSSLTIAKILGEEVVIHAFEPNPFNIERLKINLGINDNYRNRITVHEVAVSDSEGVQKFSISNNVDGNQSSGSHLTSSSKPLSQQIYDKFNFQDIDVKTTTIDALQKTLPIPDLIKIDVEGAEFFVLQGGLRLLTEFSPRLFIEVHNVSLMHDVINFLRDLNYRTRLLDKDQTSLSRCFMMAEKSK